MTAGLESTQQSKMDPVAPRWKLTVTDRRLMWLQKRTPKPLGRNFSSGHLALIENKAVPKFVD
jgi:hypothetical protein